MKIFIFKNDFGPIDYLLARLFFVEKKQCVVNHRNLLCTHLSLNACKMHFFT